MTFFTAALAALSAGLLISNGILIRHVRKTGTRNKTDMPEDPIARISSKAVEHVPVAVVITDPAGVIEYGNRYFTEHSGFSMDEVKGKNPSIFKSGRVSPATYRDMWQTIAAGKIWEGELVNRRKNGELYWERAVIRPVIEQGEITHFVAVKEDITKVRAMTADLAESEERLNLAIRAANLGLWDWDIEADESIINDRWAQMLGYRETPTGNVIEHWKDCIYPDDREWVTEELEKHISGETEVIQIEYRIVTGNNRPRWILSIGRSISRTETGRARRMVGVHLDITERKEVETSLIKAREAAMEAIQLKNGFVNTLSHEIRTPMNAIIGFLDLAAGVSHIQEPLRTYIETARGSAATLLALLNDVLDINRLESGLFPSELVVFRLPEVIEQTLELLRAKATAKGIYLRGEIEPGIPTCVSSDLVRFRQVLTNLIDNAVKFTERGGVVVHVHSVPSNRRIGFSIRDTGIGIPKDKLEAIFDSFVQADSSTTRRFGGTGLGTYISAQLVENNGGRIWVESEEGEGSTFHFTWAFEIPEEPCENGNDVVTSVEQPHEQEPADDSLRILLAEDNDTNAFLARVRLEEWGHTIVHATDGAKAADLYRSDRFDIVLMDIQMPNVDGMEATERIRAHETSTGRPRTPIVALTASSAETDHRLYMEAGLDAIVTKPIDFDKLREVLKSTTGHIDRVSPPPADETATGDRPLELDGIDIQDAIKRWSGIEYLKLGFEIFQRDYTPMVGELPRFVEAGNLESAQAFTHKLKGAAGNICATALHGKLMTLESILRGFDTGDAAQFASDADRLLVTVLASIQRSGINDLDKATTPRTEKADLEHADSEPSDSEYAVMEIVDPTYVAELLGSLRNALELHNPDAVEQLLLDAAGVLPGNEHRRIADLVARYDFDAALDCVDRTLTRISSGDEQ